MRLHRASGLMTISWATSVLATRPRRSQRRSTLSRLRSVRASFCTSRTAVRCLRAARCAVCGLLRLAFPSDVSYKLGVHLEQDPLLYTVGSEFLMPGPLGNLYQVPMNLKVRMLLQLQARKAFEIYRSVNFPRPPADFMVRASSPCAADPYSCRRACLHNRSTYGTRRSAVRQRWRSTRRTRRRMSRPLCRRRRVA